MVNNQEPIYSVSDFAWRTVEVEARSAVLKNPQVLAEMSEAIVSYQTNNFCLFRPYGKEEFDLHQKIATAIDSCSEVPMNPDSRAENYRYSVRLCDPLFLEEFNQVMRFSQLDQNALDTVTEFLQFHNNLITTVLGYPFNVLNVRCQISDPGATVPPFDWHKDLCPVSVVKILYYLDGASETAGSTAIQLDSGEEIIFKGKVGSWVLINIAKLSHKGIPSINSRRKMLEITLAPTPLSDCTAHSVGLNASYPWVPWLSPSYRLNNGKYAEVVARHSNHFNELVRSLTEKQETDNSSLQLKAAMSVHEYNANHPPKHLNIGGGPGFLHQYWRNFEEVFSVNNPMPFHLSPDLPFPIKAGTLETVYTSHNLEHLDDSTVAYVLNEGFRVLKEGGFLVIKIPDFDKYLDQWRSGDTSLTFEKSPFSFKESRTWRNKNIPDNITYRTAEMFCGLWDTKFGNEKALFSNVGDWNGPGYVGAPWIPEEDIAEVFTNTTSCHEISAYLKGRALDLGEKIYLNHQNAWSHDEMHKMLIDIGYEVVSMDAQAIVEKVKFIPGVEQWYSASAYYLAQKPA
ncbi:MAG: hypothetical protein V3T17_09320 [Pseudomonadales bacterium]